MNNKRRQQITNLIIKLEVTTDMLSAILDDETDYHDNIPENLQGSLRADNSQDAIDSLDSALSSLNDALDSLREI